MSDRIEMRVSERPIKATDCTLGFGIPTTREEFLEALEHPRGRDFVTRCCPVWQTYRHFVIEPLENVARQLRALGVDLCYGVTSTTVAEHLSGRGRPVVLLFSHFSCDAIEFFDGPAGVERMLEVVPDDFAGILDLCACQPTPLVRRLVSERRNCRVKFTDTVATPSYWLYFYYIVFKLLGDRERTYFQALEEAVKLMLQRH